eukprot:TRINITY_DN8931_c0_g1_i1.p1 TRINITY_DN8931_c0_g1~~TRINITY_DN8931_c0_g1_i1.p1  ORF type:complete len:165 (-),score=20.02 TRINITY_DN8931_c0_g1_i1:18-512(-)
MENYPLLNSNKKQMKLILILWRQINKISKYYGQIVILMLKAQISNNRQRIIKKIKYHCSMPQKMQFYFKKHFHLNNIQQIQFAELNSKLFINLDNFRQSHKLLNKVHIYQYQAKDKVIMKMQCFRNLHKACLLYTSDAADEEDSVDLGGRRMHQKKTCTKKTKR